MNSRIGGWELIRGLTKRPIDETIGRKLDPQLNLFADATKNLLLFLTFSKVTKEEFFGTLEFARPRLIVDIRLFPRFDHFGMNRRLAFHRFDDLEISYYDVAHLVCNIESAEASKDSCALLNSAIEKFVHQNVGELRGAVLVLLDHSSCEGEVVPAMAKRFRSVSRERWDCLLLPEFRQL